MKDLNPRAQETKSIEWEEIYHRLEAIQQTIERGATPSPDKKKAVLKARARALAQNSNEQSALAETVEVLEFQLGSESYGIETRFVRELYRAKKFAFLPGVPSFVLGITSVRGEILSVIDLKKFFALPGVETIEHNRVIIVQNEVMEFCIPVDNITGVRLIPLEDIKPPPPTLTPITREYLRGVTSDRTVLLDGEKILTDRKLMVDEVVRT